MSLVWNLDLPDSQKIVLLALADSANDEGHCWPSMASLTTKCSKSERTIQGVIKELVAAGHLTREEVPGKGCNYYVHPRTDCAPQASRPAEPTPPQGTTDTPAAAADKPSRTINSKQTQARGRLIASDWRPEEFGSGSKSGAIVASWDREQLEETIEHFVAHHQEKRTMATDWQPWWKTWVLNSKKFGGSRGKSYQNAERGLRGSRPDPALDMFFQAQRDLQAEAEREGSGDDFSSWTALPSH